MPTGSEKINQNSLKQKKLAGWAIRTPSPPPAHAHLVVHVLRSGREKVKEIVANVSFSKYFETQLTRGLVSSNQCFILAPFSIPYGIS